MMKWVSQGVGVHRAQLGRAAGEITWNGKLAKTLYFAVRQAKIEAKQRHQENSVLLLRFFILLFGTLFVALCINFNVVEDFDLAGQAHVRILLEVVT
jgi:hypothetical protein